MFLKLNRENSSIQHADNETPIHTGFNCFRINLNFLVLSFSDNNLSAIIYTKVYSPDFPLQIT